MLQRRNASKVPAAARARCFVVRAAKILHCRNTASTCGWFVSMTTRDAHERARRAPPSHMEAQHSKPRPPLSLAAGIIYLNPAAFAGVKQTLQTLHIASIIGVPAVTPKDYAYSRSSDGCGLFGGDGQQHTHAMSSNEIALALSHRKALRRLAQERTRWAAVFEEDAALHPKLVPTPQTAIGLLRHALTRSRFAYLGACRPTCPASGSASGCFAYCTHAYALERVGGHLF